MSYAPGQRVSFDNVPVTIRSVYRRTDDRIGYVVENVDGSTFRAHHESLRLLRPITKTVKDGATSFDVICSRAAGF